MESNKSNEKYFLSVLLSDLRFAIERDATYTAGENVCFFNTKTFELNWAEVDIHSDEDSVSVKKYENDPDYIEVPATTHHEWHEVFKNWLREKKLDGYYTTSIGLTLKHLDEIDENLRYDWEETKFEYAEVKAQHLLYKYYKPKS